MGIRIEPYTHERANAVKEFNLRLAQKNVFEELRLTESIITRFAGEESSNVCEQRFVAVDDNAAVRGGFILRHQIFSFNGEKRRIAHYRLPLSEGIVDKAYAGLGAQLLRSALQIEPLLFALGMGGEDKPLPRMLKAMGWSLWPIPFYFKVNRPKRFLTMMKALRGTTARRVAMNAAAWSGAGPLAILAVQRIKAGRRCPAIPADEVRTFGSWADEVWENCRARYGMIAERGSAALRYLYPEGDTRFIRLRMKRNGNVTGWAVLLDTQMRGHKQFGDLRVGTIVDCLGAPEAAEEIAGAATGVLEERGADLIVSNQAHAAWQSAFKRAGFFTGPSNFVIAVSKKLGAMLAPIEQNRLRVHLNRGDGDGPIHL